MLHCLGCHKASGAHQSARMAARPPTQHKGRQLPQSGAHGVGLRMRAAVLQLEHVRARRLRRPAARRRGGSSAPLGAPLAASSRTPSPDSASVRANAAPLRHRTAVTGRSGSVDWNMVILPAQGDQAMDAVPQSRGGWLAAVLPKKCSSTHVLVITDMRQDAAQREKRKVKKENGQRKVSEEREKKRRGHMARQQSVVSASSPYQGAIYGCLRVPGPKPSGIRAPQPAQVLRRRDAVGAVLQAEAVGPRRRRRPPPRRRPRRAAHWPPTQTPWSRRQTPRLPEQAHTHCARARWGACSHPQRSSLCPSMPTSKSGCGDIFHSSHPRAPSCKGPALEPNAKAGRKVLPDPLKWAFLEGPMGGLAG